VVRIMPAPLAKGEYELHLHYCMSLLCSLFLPNNFLFLSYMSESMPTCLQAPARALLHTAFSLMTVEPHHTGLTIPLLQAL
jgi:hypothetical protein